MITGTVPAKGVFFRKDAFFIGLGFTRVFVALALLGCSVASAQDCGAPAMDALVSVRSVVDGDTLRLQDGSLVRLVGINTPEIGYDGAPSQPLADEAKKFLEAQLQSQGQVGLVYEAERRDRHDRQLAHAYVRQSDAYRNLQQIMLENGLAFWVAIAPNTRYLVCYQAAEKRARRAGLGVWRETFFQPKNTSNPGGITPGFQRLRGEVTTVFKTNKFYWIKFNDSLALRIPLKDVHNFDLSELNALQGKAITARGWLFEDKSSRQTKRLTMQINHPAAIESRE